MCKRVARRGVHARHPVVTLQLVARGAAHATPPPASPRPHCPAAPPPPPPIKTAQLGEGFNGADLRNVCTEAGMFAIRDERDYVVQVCACACVCFEGICTVLSAPKLGARERACLC